MGGVGGWGWCGRVIDTFEIINAAINCLRGEHNRNQNIYIERALCNRSNYRRSGGKHKSDTHKVQTSNAKNTNTHRHGGHWPDIAIYSQRQRESKQLTWSTRLGRLRSSSSVIWVRYVGRSNTGGLSLTSLTWMTTVV